MADQAGGEEYVCPNCNEPVQPEWKACPSCGVEFAGEEEESAPPSPAAAAPKPPAAARAKPSAPPPRAAPAPPSPPKGASARAKSKEPEELPVEPKGESKSPLKIITRRVGMIGLLGLPVIIVGVFGLVAAMNYDVWFAGQSGEAVGPKQMNAMLGTIVVAGLGVFLTVLGFVRARSPAGRAAEDLAPAQAEPEPSPPPVEAAPAPPRVAIQEPEEEAEAAPAPELEEEEEAEDEFALPPAPARAARAEPARAAPPPAPAPAPAPAPTPPPAATAAAAPAERDELEDLFGELESEVAKAEEDEIHYECPNCHGIVREDDSTCPHCHVSFEG